MHGKEVDRIFDLIQNLYSAFFHDLKTCLQLFCLLFQFLAWLSEAESACENAEQEIERKPHIIMVSAYKTDSGKIFS